MNIYTHVERLLSYGIYHFNLSEEDAMYAKNRLYAQLNLDDPTEISEEFSDVTAFETPDALLSPLLLYAVEKNITTEERKPLLEAQLMGLLLPAPSAVIAKFQEDYKTKGSKTALLNFYNHCIKSNYIKMNDVRKNILWTAKADKADLIITVNLSKPEKDNKEIARLKSLPQKAYPKCMLCFENLGFEGRLNFPARQTLRIIPVTLDGEAWYLQFSPYVYYDQHCIAFSKEHKPMTLSKSTFRKFADFLELFPEYFIGSNACLPIVGGSILTHEHFQGGGYEMPMHKCKPKKQFKTEDKEVFAEILDWYNSVVTVRSKNKEKAIETASMVLNKWQNYSDESVGILANTAEPHNAVTPIARKVGEYYQFDLILRNNRTDESYPDGIYHAHPEHHNIKKEGIGIIEVMGLFILPGRLQSECGLIEEILQGKTNFDSQKLAVHKNMVESLLNKHGNNLNQSQAEKAVKEFINGTCIDILRNTAVFKEDEKGIAAFERFMKSCGFEK